MATIIENKKGGKIVSYKFRTYLGKDEFGKQVMRYTTWKPSEKLTPSKYQKAAEKAAAEWEKTVRQEYEKDLENPERVVERNIQLTCTEFTEFVNGVGFPVFVCDGNHRVLSAHYQ